MVKTLCTDKKKKTLKKDFRTSEWTWNRLTILANEYSGGNKSAWINYAIVNAPRKYVVKRPKP